MTILQTVTEQSNVPFIIILGAIVLDLALFIAIINFAKEGSAILAIIYAIFAIAITFGIIILLFVPTYETIKYQVILDDDYPAVEFFEKYDMIERAGDTYWVQERTDIDTKS